jgi:predicted acylesterase/phospholipase RssA
MGKIAFVLAGGGAAGAYQLGCLKAVYEKTNIRPDFITANSAGSLNATGLSYAGLPELEEVWRSIKRRQDIFGDRFLGFFTPLFGADSLWTSKPLRKKLEKLMEYRVPKIPYWVNYTNLQNGKLTRAHCDDSNFPQKVLASASIPVITEPVNGIFVDGGVRENTPLGFAIDQGADKIFVFLNSSQDPDLRLPYVEKFDGVREIAARTLNIMSDEMYWGDIHIAEHYNLTRPDKKKVAIFYFAPKKNTIDTLDFKPEKITGAIEQGYQETLISLREQYLYT